MTYLLQVLSDMDKLFNLLEVLLLLLGPQVDLVRVGRQQRLVAARLSHRPNTRTVLYSQGNGLATVGGQSSGYTSHVEDLQYV